MRRKNRIVSGNQIIFHDGKRRTNGQVMDTYGDIVIVRPVGQSYVMEIDSAIEEIEILL